MKRNRTLAKIIGISLLSLSLAFGPGSASVPAAESPTATVGVRDLRLFLNSFVSLGEGHIGSALRGLRVISLTEEAKSGEWQRMRGLLAEFGKSGIKAATVWFVRPDGSYYTAEKGATDQNLRERPYFPKLMAGEDVMGELVVSKSTGRRTAVVAVPVKKEGKVVGAVGASLSVVEISRMLDQEMGLPQNIFFYALDKQGQTALHRISTLLFAYPSDMGSKSLAKTVDVMLSTPEGEVTYDFYGERSVVFRKSPLTGWVFAVGIVTGRPGRPGADPPPALLHLQNGIAAELDKLDRDLAGVAAAMSGKDIAAAGRRKMFEELCGSYPYAVDCALVDRNGKIAIVEPAGYREYEGRDISGQEQVIRLRKTGKPVLSNVFRSVEGFDAVDLEHPVFSGGEFEGSVSVLIRPESLFAYVLEPLLRGGPVEAFAMQTNGRILYDQDRAEVGRMLFEDPMYKPFPQLVAVGTMICREKTGSGSYEFRQAGSGRMVTKDAYWTTIGLHGTDWRLVVMHVRPQEEAVWGEGISETDPAAALKALANDDGLKKACGRGDDAAVGALLRRFYAEHPGPYSVQWLDADGVNRYGYPEENSLINYDMKGSKVDSAGPMLRALSGEKESAFVSPLVEGKTGAFLMEPVYNGREYLGMVYTIVLKK